MDSLLNAFFSCNHGVGDIAMLSAAVSWAGWHARAESFDGMSLQQPAPVPSQPPAVSWYMLQCSASAAAGTPPAAGGVISTALGWTDLLTEESFGDAAPGSPYDRAGAISMLEGLQTVASALTEANEAVGVGARWELAQAAAMKTLRLDMPPPSIPAEPDPGWKTWDALQRLMRDGDPYIRTAAQSLASRAGNGVCGGVVFKNRVGGRHTSPKTPTEAVAQFLANQPDWEINILAAHTEDGTLCPNERADAQQRLRALANNSVIVAPFSAMPQFQNLRAAGNVNRPSLWQCTTVVPNNSIVFPGGSDLPNLSLVAIFPPGRQPASRGSATITAATLQIVRSLTLTRSSTETAA